MKKDVINFKGEKIDTIELSDLLFGVKPNFDLMTQSVRVWKNNKYGLLTGKTKTRAEVSGGGRKPWRQKGTGRARHGSIRSPLWVHGGVAHGPKPNRILRMSRKMQRASLISALSLRARDGALILLDDLDNPTRTRELAQKFETLGQVKKGASLVIVANKTEALTRSASNLPKISIIPARIVNTVSVLKNPSLVIIRDALPLLEERLLIKKVLTPKEKGKAEILESVPVSKVKESLEDLNLSNRALNALHKAGYSKASQIKDLDEETLLAIKGLGKGSVKEILEVFKSRKKS